MMKNEKEYLMLRTEIENNLKRQDALFMIIFTLLSVVNVTNYEFWNYKILLLISTLIFFLQLKILQARNTVYYLLTYLIVFLEDDNSDFHWESRLYKFRKMRYTEKDLKLIRRILSFINKIIEKIATYIHNLVNLVLASYLYLKIIFMLPMATDNVNSILALIMASVVFALNFLCAIKISFDKSLKDRYLKLWKQLKIEETKEEIKLKGKENCV